MELAMEWGVRWKWSWNYLEDRNDTVKFLSCPQEGTQFPKRDQFTKESLWDRCIAFVYFLLGMWTNAGQSEPDHKCVIMAEGAAQ